MAVQKPLLIGDLAKLAGVKADTIRFYEKRGLLSKPAREANGYRIYGEAALRQLRFIRKAQALGFALNEIQRVLSLRGPGRERCRCVIAIAEATLAETERKLSELERFRGGLQKMLARWRRLSHRKIPVAGEFCALIEGIQLTGEASSPELRAGK